MASTAAVFVPMNVDCFVLNEAVCTPSAVDDAKVAPITQPNYTYLRYEQKYLAGDILRYTDLHGTGSVKSNSRITNLGLNVPIEGRKGVYVHWMIPRPYRTGAASADAQTGNQKDRGQLAPELAGPQPKPTSEHSSNSGGPPPTDSNNPAGDAPKTSLSSPSFLNLPTRFLVIRRVHLDTVEPKEATNNNLIPELTSWVIESDHKQSIDDLEEGVDLQTDVSPYIATPGAEKRDKNAAFDTVDISKQAEVFVGSKWDASLWEEKQRERVTLNLANSSNQLFADFQPHNSNVFSMVDTLTYTDNGTIKRILKARISYYVIGWHSTPEDDIFYISSDDRLKVKRSARLSALNMVLRDDSQGVVGKWNDLDTSTRTLCHGAKYHVEWDYTQKPKTPADVSCQNLMRTPAPVSVGTTPLDSVLAYVHAFQNTAADDTKNIRDSLLKIEAQLIARDEGVEPQQRALNLVSNANFKRYDGGKRYYFAATDEDATDKPVTAATTTEQPVTVNKPLEPKVPTDTEIENVRTRNQNRMWTDTIARLGAKYRWDMFGTWWSYLYDRAQFETLTTIKARREGLRKRINDINTKFLAQDAAITNEVAKLPTIQTGVMEPFYQANDPTLMVAGVASGWPHDYLDPLLVRLETQAVRGETGASLRGEWKTYSDEVLGRVIPGGIVKASRLLFEEFSLLQPESLTKALEDQVPPLYHDNYLDSSGNKNDSRWRDRWNSVQPFFPLYLEWEVEYVHIPFKFWKLVDWTTEAHRESKARYVIDLDAFQKEPKTEGSRFLSGRSLILPQPGFSLEAKVEALFSQMPATQLEELIKETDRKALKRQLRQLPLLSSPLTGFIDHLLTKLHGTHVKSNNKSPTGISMPIESAIKAAVSAEFEADDLKLIDADSDLTPYSSAVQFADDRYPAFKPVTHGQFRFTKLNVIDKFGQAIHAIDPRVMATRKSLYPCTSEYYAPQRLFQRSGAEPPPADPDAYEFIQIPPQVNQFARLNASFVTFKESNQGVPPYWQATTEWENPVWGWVVINYANYGLQFFLADGTFYREVRSGGPSGSLASPEWLPFGPSKDPVNKDPATVQLQNLITRLAQSASYLRAFIGMIDACMPSLLPAPVAYAEQMSAVVGRPLALVNTGWSLELATEISSSWALGGQSDLPLNLAEKDTSTRKEKFLYEFNIHIGSREKAYDALVGYFPAKDLAESKPGDGLDLDKLYTYYHKTDAVPIKQIDKEPRPTLKPFYFNPLNHTVDELERMRCREQIVLGTVMDPFSPIHGYTSILPIKELSLPSRVWEQAFTKMKTFFRIGPLLIQKSVPDEKGQISLSEVADGVPSTEPKLGIPVPAPTIGTWNWLQPYFHKDPSSTPESTTGETIFTRLKLDKVDHRARFEDAPYTAMEGFLQLSKVVGEKSTA